ncbi:hypothetical protein ACFQ1S_17900, partial [Kibdelosporangium lantanae]
RGDVVCRTHGYLLNTGTRRDQVIALFGESNRPTRSVLSPMYFNGISKTSPERPPAVRSQFIA